MQRSSHAIFVWDEDDVRALKAAKQSELTAQHIHNPSEADKMRAITKAELALHCRRTTRGEAETTTRLIQELIDAFDGDKGRDTLGVPLINSVRMSMEWEGQKKHVGCLQDPPGVQLYIQTGTLNKFGHVLPTYRCCRGSTSLESYHLHLNRFISGTQANDIVFQAYLVDGLSRWSQDRATKAAGSHEPTTYSGLMRHTANMLSQKVFKKNVSSYTAPRVYTGELIGLEYLYDQTGRPLQEYDQAIQTMEEKGLPVDRNEEATTIQEDDDITVNLVIDPLPEPAQLVPPVAGRGDTDSRPVLSYPTESKYQALWEPYDKPVSHQATPEAHDTSQETITLEDGHQTDLSGTSDHIEESVGPDNIPGFDRVQALAKFLATLKDGELYLTQSQANELVSLWGAMTDHDKRQTKFSAIYSKKTRGRFRAKRDAAPGIEHSESTSIADPWEEDDAFIHEIMETGKSIICVEKMREMNNKQQQPQQSYQQQTTPMI